MISKNLERIADCSTSLAEVVSDLHKIRDTLNEEELQKMSYLTDLTKQIFKKATSALFLSHVITANEAINLSDKLSTEVEAPKRKAAIPYFRAIAIMLAMIAENSASIAVLTINIKISESNYLP